MFKQFQNWADRQRAKQFKKVLLRAYADYMVGKIAFEGVSNSEGVQGLFTASATPTWDTPKTADEIIKDIQHAANMLSRRARK